MKRLWLKVCSLILVAAMMVQSLPVNVFADQTDTIPPVSTEDFIELEEMDDVPQTELADISVVEEHVEGRTEFSKEFLLDNGLNLAVVYDAAVHFEKNGQWEEIDNTLQAKADGTYTNKAGVWDVAFPQQLTKNNQITITKDGYTLSFGMAGELRQQGNLEVMSTGSETALKEIEVPPVSATPEEVTKEEASEDTAADIEPADIEIPEAISAQSVTLQSGTDGETLSQEETDQEEVLSEETNSEQTVAKETIPEGTEATIEIPEQDTAQATATVLVDGNAQTFAVSSAQAANGQVLKIDRKELLEEAKHEETILEKPFSQLKYENVYANTDVRYDLIGNQVKESVILEAYSSTLRGYQFNLNTGALIPVLADDGHIEFYDAAQKNIIMVMPAPYLVDSNNVYCGDVRISLTGKDGIYTLTYLLPQQWLAAEERAWPVVLDPIVAASMSVLNIQDRTVGSNQSYSYNYTINEVGVGLGNGKQRFFVKYNTLPTLTSADVILEAGISLYKPSSTTTVVGPVEVHKVTETWESTTMTWANQPDMAENVEDYVIGDASGYYDWIITDIVRDWYAGTNTGMGFKVPTATENNTSTASWMQFYSSEYSTVAYRPTMWIYFRNNNGLESYWDYTTSSAGRAGTAYVNQYTGNMTWIHNDIGFGGNRMPVSISHVYNTNDSQSAIFGMGNGWRTNFNQRVYQWTENTSYYIWEDGDGTAHYFRYVSSSTYEDEDGLGLTLTTNGSGTSKYKIVDKKDNASYFDTQGRLTKQENFQQIRSVIQIAYSPTNSQYISQITDGAGRKYNFTYDGNNRLSEIVYTGSGSTEITSISFAYNSSNNLTSIAYADSKTTNFSYGTNNLLTSGTDIDGYKLEFEYDTMTAGLPSRVKKISEHDDELNGGELNFEYGYNQTILSDHNGNAQVLQFNNWGNTVSIQDGEGHAQYARFANNNPLTDTTNKGNQLKLSSKMQNTVKNYILNSNFETASDWTPTGSTVSSSNITDNENTQIAYMGNRCVKVTTSATSNGAGIQKSFTVSANETYTFSAYVKTSSASGYLAITQGSTTVTSDVLPKYKDWTRLQVTYTATTSGTAIISLLTKDAGALYIDCAQFENAATASRYNLVENSDFSTSGYWTNFTTASVLPNYTANVTVGAPQLDNTRGVLVGNPQGSARIHQEIQSKGKAGDVYVVGGWAKGYSVPLKYENGYNRRFSITVNFMKYDNEQKIEVSTSTVAFNPCVEEWQYMADAVVADGDYEFIKVQVNYDYNANTAYFDGIQLYKEEFGQSFTYDDDGNVISVVDLQKQETKYEYEDNNLTKEILPNGTQMTYEYDANNNLETATTSTGLVYTFAYDDYGNNTSVSLASSGKTIVSSANYSDDGNVLQSVRDATGYLTRYGYHAQTNVLNWVQYPEDTASTRTAYTYDSMYRMLAASTTTDTGLNMFASYLYENDQLKTLTTATTAYGFTYGPFGLRTAVSAGERTLAQYFYTDVGNSNVPNYANERNFYLKKLAYGNGDSVNYTYDQQGRTIQQAYKDDNTVTETVSYLYNNDGALASVKDSGSGITTTYYYDFIDRLMKYVETGGAHTHSMGYEYDTINNLTKLVEDVDGEEHTTEYGYDNDNRVVSVVWDDTISKTYVYDAWGRVSEQQTKNGNNTIKTDVLAYRNKTSTTETTTSAQIDTHTIQITGNNKSFTYSYDMNGNIVSIKDENNKTISYVYDSANQLIRENNEITDITTTWTYDEGGNIAHRYEYDYTTGTLGGYDREFGYTYQQTNNDDPAWDDLLVSYNGQAISYDAIGNPTTYLGWTMSWKNGRELASMSKGSTTWNFTYNADGIRTKRTNGTTTYHYVYNGDKLSYLQLGNDELYFSYDASGNPMTVEYNGTTYYYVTNIQGDVIAILNSSGTAVVEYTYDAWGNIFSTTGSMATTLGKYNPLRYRGYVYDEEYGLYYLQSRYYNPEVGRFLNTDNYPATGQGLLGNNMFSYCLNNPVVLQDSMGQSALLTTLGCLAIGGVIGGIANYIAVVSSGGSARDCALGALAGFVGGVAGAGAAVLMTLCPATTPYAEVGGRVIATLATDFCTSWFINGKVTKEDFAYTAVDITMDLVFSTITYGYVPFDPAKQVYKRAIVNTTIDGIVDVGQNELFNPNSTTNRNSTSSNYSTTKNHNTARYYAHQKVGRLIGAI